MKKTTTAIIILIILSFVIATYSYYNIKEDKIASHWNAKGEVDDYMSKFWGVYLFPFIFIFLYGMFLLIPKIDPLKKNIEKFRKYYDWFILLIFLFLFYVFVLTILANLGYMFNMTTMMMPALALFFFVIGMFLPKIKRNWFMGIRTPWTISNDIVWEKTHELGGKFFKGIGILIILGLFIPGEIFFPVFISFTLFMVVFLVVYSYQEFRKVEK